MPYNPDVRRQALAGSAIGLRDGGQSEDDWSQKQLNELDWEARQALHSGVLTPKQYEQLQRTRDGIGPNFIQKYLLGQWGEDNPATGSALDTIGSILDTASLSTHFGSLTKAALEADSDPDLFTPGELIRHPEHLADHWTNALIFTAPGFAWHTGKGLASWFDNYRNAQSMARVADEVDLWDSMAELGIYRPIGPKTFANPLPSLVPGMGAASVVGSATDALGLTEEGATLGGRIKPVLTQAAEAASGIAQASNAGGALDTAFRAVAAATSGNDEQPFLARMADPTLPSLYEAGKSPATQAVDLARTAADLTQLPTTGQEAIDPHIADVNAWLRQQKRDFIGNDRDGYFLTPTERFIGQWTLDAALDPTTYLTFGLAPGARLSVKLAKNGTFRMGDQVVQLATAPRKGKVTLTKQGTHLFRMALADFVNESGSEVLARGVPLVDTHVDSEQTAHRVLELMGQRWNKYKEMSIYQAGVATARKYVTQLEPFWQEGEDLPTMLARLEADQATPPSVQNIIRQVRTAEARVGALRPEDLFEEAGDWLHRPRRLYSPELAQAFQQRVADLPFIGKPARWFWNTFDSTWNMPSDAVELAHDARRRVQVDLDESVARYTEAFQHFDKRQRETIAELVESRWARQHGYPSALQLEYTPEMEAAADFFTKEMDEIILREQERGIAINSVEDYVSHIITLHPNVREQWTNLLRKNGEVAPSASNRYAQQRLIATLAQVEDILGEGAVEKDAFKILAMRRRASAEMLAYSDFFKYTSERYGVPAAILMSMSKGEGADLIRTMARRNADGVHEIIPVTQVFTHESSTLRTLGFREGDVEHNARLIEYLSQPLTQEPGGRFSPEGLRLADELGVDAHADLHRVERPRTLDVPTVGRVQGVKLREVPKHLRFSVQVPLRAKGPAAGKTRRVDFQFSPSELLRMLNDPHHPAWQQLVVPGGIRVETKGVEAAVGALDSFLRRNLDASVGALVPDLEEKLLDIIGDRAGLDFKWIERLVKKSQQSVEVHKLKERLPQALVEHARRTRLAAGDLTSEAKPSRSDIAQLHYQAGQLGFNKNLLDQFIEKVIGKKTIENAEEAHTIIEALAYWQRYAVDKEALSQGLPDFHKIGGERMVKFTLVQPKKLQGNTMLPELFDQNLGIPAAEPVGKLPRQASEEELLAALDPEGAEVPPSAPDRLTLTGSDLPNYTEGNVGSTRQPFAPPVAKKFWRQVLEVERAAKQGMSQLDRRFKPLREMTWPPRKKGDPPVVKAPEPKTWPEVAPAAEAKLGNIDEQFPMTAELYGGLDDGLTLIGDFERHGYHIQTVLDSDEMKLARDRKAAYVQAKLEYQQASELVAKDRASRRQFKGKLSKIKDEGLRALEAQKAARKKMNEALAAYDAQLESSPIWLSPKTGKQQTLTYRDLLVEGRKLREIRESLGHHRQQLIRLYKRWEHAMERAPTSKDAVRVSGLARGVPAGNRTFQTPEYLAEARQLERPGSRLGALRSADARARALSHNEPAGIIDGQLAPATGQQSLTMYVPESLARLMKDLQAPDIPPGISAEARRFLYVFDQGQALFKTNMMLPWGAYWNRNLMSNSLLLYTGAGLHFLKPQVMTDFFKLWFYGLAKYSDLPAVMGVDPKSKPWERLGKLTLDDWPGGRGNTVAEIFDDARLAGTVTGVTSTDTLSVPDAALMPDWAKRVVGGLTGATAGAAVGAAAGALTSGLGGDAASDRRFSQLSLLGLMAGAMLGGRRLTTSGVPIRSGRGVTAMLQSSFKPLLRNGEMATEAPLRLLLYTETLRRTGSPLAAKQAVHRHMNDWMNLGVVERRWLRRAFPFYTWTKFATQQSFRSILEHPDRVHNIFRTFSEWNRAHEADPEDVPEWYHEKLYLMGQEASKDKSRIAGSTLYSGFGATYEDTADLMSFIGSNRPLQELAGKLMARGPLGLTAGIDGLLDRDSFTGRAISTTKTGSSYFGKGKEWETAPEWLQRAVGYRPATPNSAAVVDHRIAWALGKTPSSRFFQFIREIRSVDEEGRKRLDYNALARSLLGVNAYALDPKTGRYFKNQARIEATAILLQNVGWLKASTVYSDRNPNDATPGGGTRRRRKQRSY